MQRKLSVALSIVGVLVLAVIAVGEGSGSVPPPPTCAAVADPGPTLDAEGIRIELVRAEQVASAVVENSTAGKALLERLPLTVQLRDSFGLAMVGEVPRLPVAQGVPLSCGVGVGELGYSPTDQAIAVFHSPQAALFSTPEVVRLGVVTDGLEAILDGGPVTIRRVG